MENYFSELKKMKYSGRGITIGMTPAGNPFIGYTLTGRSQSSQARRLVYDEAASTVRIDVTDPEQLKKGNPALLIYPAIISANNKIVASNGVQTKLLMDAAMDETNITPVSILLNAMRTPVFQNEVDITKYEPDSPNFTPRISGCVDKISGGFYIVRKGNPGETDSIFSCHDFFLEKGHAKTIATYLGGNENPLLPFTKNPLEARIKSNSANEIVRDLYDSIGPKDENNFRVSAAVMMMIQGQLKVEIINRYEKGE